MRVSEMNISTLLLTVGLLIPMDSLADSLRLGTDEWPPYEYRDRVTGEITGFSTELILSVLKRLDVEVGSIRQYPWARVEREAQSGMIDVIYSLNSTEERHHYLHFPDEALDRDLCVLFIRRDHKPSLPIRQVDDLAELSLGVVRGYAYSPEVRSILSDFDRVTEVTDETQLFNILERGRVDGIITYLSGGQAVIDRMGIADQITALTEPFLFKTQWYAAFSKKSVSREFVERFSQALKDFKQTSQYSELRQKYFWHD
jgi:polar amino acid transport system substrate-binding protein